MSFDCANFSDKIADQKLVMVKATLLQMYNKNYKWGTLIGVRPTKLVRRLLNLNFSFDEIDGILEKLYLVSKEKRDLLIEVVKKEENYLKSKELNIYIGIPFCPTKCKYCSFASYEMTGKQGESYGIFVKTLLEEIDLTSKFLKEEKLTFESIYMGGGTPTTLSENDLEKVLKAVTEKFPMEGLKEFTVEAGRVDTLTYKKLEIMKSYGVHRISINPQTFNEKVLKDLNRYFDKTIFDDMYNKAKDLGFIINMDFIIGLPNETTEDILKTLEIAKTYDIENLTIHMLALKKASRLYKEGHELQEIDYVAIDKAIKELVENKGLKPYYMYRQKNSLEWGENIGYAKEGKESMFNIHMIEESQSTFGLGGGAITKYTNGLFDEDIDIKRVVNAKEPIAYIQNMRDRFEKKVELFRGKKI